MRTSDKGIIALISHEGIVPAPYKDSVGVWTFGVGHTAAAGEPNPASMPRGMPSDLDAAIARAFEVFRRDLQKYEADVSRAFPGGLSQEKFDAAVSFHFNTGAINRASWAAAYKSGDVAGSYLKFMNWSKPASIIKRREAELRLFRDGVYPSTALPVWRVNAAGKVIFDTVRTLRPAEALALMRGGVRPDIDHSDEPPAAPWWVHLFQAIARAFK